MEPNTVIETVSEQVAIEQSTVQVDTPLAVEELLVEEISIDGMCGVY